MSLELFDPDVFAGGFPHDHFRRLRAEQPVFRAEHPAWPTGYWNLVRHADVQRVSRNPEVWSNQPTPFLDTNEGAADDAGSQMLLISLDPPDHTKMRKLVNRGFTPKRVADLTDKIQGTVDRLLDDVATRTSCDMVSDIAVELPLQVIADLVGVPPEDRHQVFEWTEKTFGFDAAVSQEERHAAAMAMYAYADQMCEIRKTEPSDDLISVLMEAEVDGESLDQMQIDVFFMLLQNAGSETTRNLITSGTVALLDHPDQLDLLRSDLDAHLEPAIEELLRYVTPVMQFVRRAKVDTEVAGQEIAAGDPVVLWYSSANRDEEVFADPDRLDITRNPNPQVAFGAGGPHFCLGASLARLEARIMFRELLTRVEGLELDADPASLPRVRSNLIDGLASMPIRWDAIRDKQPTTA